MTGLGIYKLDNGESYPSQCFPIRSFFYPSNKGAGHWLVAHRNTLEARISKKTKVLHVELHSGKRTKTAGNILDAELLVTLHCVDKPSDLCSVNISDQGLQKVRLEGLEEFDNIAYINASDNHLTLEPFSKFPALRELELSLNSLHTVEIHAEDFQKLEVLDLSFNSITGESMLNLGLLPHLKVLHLTGNHLQMLPLDMAGPCTCPEEHTHQCVLLFQTLEVLMLEDNRLTSPGVFMSLANLKRLQHLNLQGNFISGVPFLKQMAPLQDAQKTLKTHSTMQRTGNPLLFQDVTINDASETLSQQKSTTGTSKRKDHECPEDFGQHFPELRHLNLAKNQIAEEEALLPVALFPKLNELVIHSNPLTTQRCGDPPMLTSFLQEQLGIKIRRKKSSDLKQRISPTVSPKRKVKTRIPRVPDNVKDRTLPIEYRLKSGFSSSSKRSIEEEDDIAIGHEHFDNASIASERNRNEETFFVTEIDVPYESDHQKIQEDEKRMVKKHSKVFPEKLAGYEILFDEESEPEMPEISGIQHAVRTLEHTLKNLLVYRDSKANLDRPQKPYTEREKKIRNLPPLGPKKSKGEKVEEILTQMKETKTTSKVPLVNVLSGGKNICKEDYEEALTLLKDMQRRYKMAHRESMEQAAHLEIKEI
ncbi:X-ray radiation resistance-associated protein 1 isoform X2 [Paramisgurnus dabryanus]|uniref:X-ray radiation resistance-associated protein 1 isoform X2 n=1 Tax=Paramisgurnus dabryanus TaxID=90735 RepID=UPI0031F3F87A